MITNSNGKFVSTIEREFIYFDKLPREIREYVVNYPRKIAAEPIYEWYNNLKTYSPYNDQEINELLIQMLEESK